MREAKRREKNVDKPDKAGTEVITPVQSNDGEIRRKEK
jgi:hypothetical protein